MAAISRRAFAGLAGLGAATLALGAMGVPMATADEASPAEDFLFEEVDGLIAITGYVGQSEEVVVPRSINGSLVGLIWDGAFANKTAIFKVTLPKGVAYIGEGAFAGCISLEEIVLPEGFEGPFFLDTYPEWTKLVTPEGEEVAPEKWFDGTSLLPVVEFGSYPQSGDTPEPIQWLVLEERADGTALLLSRRCLACRPYHGERTDVTWEMCDLRAWLNGEFLQAAFSDEERSQIVGQHLENSDNPKYDTPGGADTDDSAFCLGLQEVEHCFGVKPDHIDSRLGGYPTQRALEDGAKINSDGACVWWLRSPGDDADQAASVYGNERLEHLAPTGDCWIEIDTDGNSVDRDWITVRPAIVVESEAIS